MSKARFLHDNFIESSQTVTLTASSERSGFPGSNATRYDRRSQVWRSAGYWDIQSGSNTIVFRETTGVDLTATVTATTYSTTTLLLAAIKTALEAAGDSTYTVTQDSTTQKIKIASNGGGGGGIFQLRWTSSTAMASTLGFDPTLNLTGALTYTADTLKIHTEEWLEYDLGLALNPKAFVLTGARNQVLKLSTQATIYLQGNDTTNWTSPQFSTTLSYDRYALILTDSVGIASQGYRYWRVKILDASNPLGYLEIALLYLGDFFEPTRGGIQFPFSRTLRDATTVSVTANGYAYANVLEKHYEMDLNYYGLTVTEKESLEDIFETFGKGHPFIVSLDPNAAFGSLESKHLHFVRFNNEPGFTLSSPGVFGAQIQLREEL
jgi:hypothetical protein